MIEVCVTLLLLHQGYALAPVTTVQLGEPATFTCVLPFAEWSSAKLRWYKQSVGDNPKLIAILVTQSTPAYEPEFRDSRFDIKRDKNVSNLTILRTTEDDEGMYHCAVIEWTDDMWSGTYLSLKGNTQRTSNYTVVQQSSVSDPGHPGGSRSLQCSVLSDSENKTCPGDHSVFWFRLGSDKFHPNILYTDGNRRDECEERSDTQKSCVYHFSKNISSSDDGTYYCAVATCGEILFGNGAEVEIERKVSSEFIALVIAVFCLVISLIGNIVLIRYQVSRPTHEQFKGIENTASEARCDNSHQPVHDNTQGGDKLNYAALNFSGRKATREQKKNIQLDTEESVYSQVQVNMCL